MRVPFDAIISISSDPSFTYKRCISFNARYFVSSRNEIPQAGETIEADLGDQYANAFITNVKFDMFNSQVEIDAQVVESFPIASIPEFSFDPSSLKQQLIDIFKHKW